MFGRGRDGYDDYELEQRMDDIDDRRSTSGPFDDLIMVVFVAFIAIGAIGAGLGWLDHRFGWGLLPWFQDWISGLVGSK
jgi:hypothetical protein